MQLKRNRAIIRHRLVAASCALLGAATARAQDANGVTTQGQSRDWTLDSALAYYHENGRIQAIEPIVELRNDFGNGDALDLKLTIDSLSGASPNGALTSDKPQTFASPSGKSKNAYTIAPGQLPVDAKYHDDRLAVAASWEQPLTRITQLTFGGKLSYEHDFLSASANAGIAHDFNQKNTTVSLGLNGEFDTIRPIGGAPVAASNYTLFEKTTNAQHKNGGGAMLGLTQVLTPRWLSELNLSVDRFSGYLNDPYKIISVLDAVGDTQGYLYERRPSERLRRSVYLDNRVGWNRMSLGLSLRYMNDDWQVHSYTAQAHLRIWNDDKDQFLEPTVRWYQQSAAFFYTPWLWNTSGPFTDASSDQRLSALHALTYGLKYGVRLDGGQQELNVRFEYYAQMQTGRLPAPAALQGLDLYPGLTAILVQVGWQF